jgi:drug/metabolite transporter (DMT)-like permease
MFSRIMVMLLAACYVVSGVCQPLLMTLMKEAGLVSPSAQLYMLFYYAGPALMLFSLLNDVALDASKWPSRKLMLQAAGIACFDVFAQTLNYTGATLSGPTIFAIVYSSVTVWTAVFSRLLLQRRLLVCQWLSVCVVFGGLVITALDSISLGPDVVNGTLLILFGSSMHAITYVWSECVMIGNEGLSVSQNSAIQGVMAFSLLLCWQIIYTAERWDVLIEGPMTAAGTTASRAITILLFFAMVSLIHSYSFYYTVKHYPGGATSAGVMKGLQAVLVFIASHFAYCGRYGGSEMCFSSLKLVSLVTVVSGVLGFSILTERQHRKAGYTPIETEAAEELEVA